jgi:hypothetical protein
VRTVLALVLMFASVACDRGVDTSGWPPAEGLYRIENGSVVCDGTYDQHGEPTSPPFTYYQCMWRNVTYGGAPACMLVLDWSRPNAASAWSPPAVFSAGPNDCG